MVVRIVHGHAESLYSTLLKGNSSQNSPEQQKEVQAKVAPSGNTVAGAAQTSDAVKISLSTTQAGQQATQLARMSGDAVVTSLRSTKPASGAERIETYKEAKQVTDDLAERMNDEPGQSMQAHDLDETKGTQLK